jgi:RNA-directed DNA polymerase
METELSPLTEKARREQKYRFRNVAYLVNAENLKESLYRLKGDRASGIDGVSMEEYERNLDTNIADLVVRMKRQAYKPQAVRRTYITKANGKLRPLGIPTVEDKMVQLCVTMILEALYEGDFSETSYGFRKVRSCHMALGTLNNMIMEHPVNYVIDADIKGFFDNVNHDWMMECLKQRIADESLLRLIKRFLISGYVEEGKYYATDEGTPQGGVISPMLANIYLHYVLDVWMTKVVTKRMRGYVEMIRYADDFVICVQAKAEAEKILAMLKERLGKFGLELAEDKTRIVEFGRYAEKNSKGKGGKPGTFNFLGFTHYCGRTRKGGFKVGRKTDRKKFVAKMKVMNKWLKSVRSCLAAKEWWPVLQAKLRGHYQYYGMSENSRGIAQYYYAVKRLVFKWMNRRSQKKSMNWDQFKAYCSIYKLPPPRIYFNLYTSSFAFKASSIYEPYAVIAQRSFK